MADAPTPIQIDPSAVTPILLQIVTKLLAIGGAWLAAHGVFTQDQIDGLISPLAQQIVGVALSLGALAWATLRTKWGNDKLVTIKTSPQTSVPDAVAKLTGPTNA